MSFQLSWNYNYGQFQDWLHLQGIDVDLMKEPNLLLTKMDPPLAMLSALWYYMTPQPPKPSMHDIMMGRYVYEADSIITGSRSGPFSLVFSCLFRTRRLKCSMIDIPKRVLVGCLAIQSLALLIIVVIV